LIDKEWFKDGNHAYEITLDDMYAWIGDDSNKAALAELGISRIIAIHTAGNEFEVNSFVTSTSFDNAGFALGAKTIFTLPVYADLIDVASGKLPAQLDMIAKGSESGGIAIFLLIPIPYGTEVDAFEKGVEAMATVTAYALMGARLVWPDSFVPLVAN
jgi:hypothetical protein